MKLFLMSLTLGIATTGMAAVPGYDLKVDVSVNGEKIAAPRVSVKAGEPATITHQEFTLWRRLV